MELLIIVLIIIASIAIAGIHFVRFSLLRKEGFDMRILPDNEKNITPGKEERKRIITMNTEKLDGLRDRFLQNTDACILKVKTKDNLNLIAEAYGSAGSHRYAILVHGYMGTRKQMRHLAAVYSSWGFNTVLPDNRAHGESEGKWIGMGWLDKDDILLWIRKITEMDNDAEIVLHGISMGGATVMMVSGLDLGDNVKAIIEDCGYTSVWDIFKDELKAIYHLPPFPLLYSFSVFARLLAGYSPRKASSLEMLQKAEKPVLFIHGSDDHFVQTHMIEENFNACASRKEKLIINDAGHAEAYLREPELYFDSVRRFIDSCLS